MAQTNTNRQSNELPRARDDILVIVGCGSAKQDLEEDETVPARDLYTSNFAHLKRDYGDAHGGMRILSAEHGIVRPDTEIGYYDTHISDLSDREQNELAVHAVQAIRVACREHDTSEVHLLVGQDYRDVLADHVGRLNARVRWPLSSFDGIGYQMGWLSDALDEFEEHDGPAEFPRW